EMFLLSSANIGILVPRGLLITEALLTAGCGLLYLGAGGMLIPLSRPRTPSAAAPRFLSIKVPGIVLFLNRIGAVARKAQGFNTLACGLLMVAGIWALVPVLEAIPRGSGTVRWGSLSAPPGTDRGVISPVRIHHRAASIPLDLAGERISLTLDVEATEPAQ